MNKYAMVERDGFKVPLIGIPPDAVLEECDLCHDKFPQGKVEFNGKQMICKKCRKEEK